MRCGKRLSPLYCARGFTLQELLITLTIASALMAGGVSLQAAITETTKSTAINELITHLHLARSEAVTRRARITLCPTRDWSTCHTSQGAETQWHHGWMVYSDANENDQPDPDEILRVHQGTRRGVLIRTARSRSKVVYQPSGTAGGSTITFAFCDARGADFARYITVSNTGRARVSQTTSSAIRC